MQPGTRQAPPAAYDISSRPTTYRDVAINLGIHVSKLCDPFIALVSSARYRLTVLEACARYYYCAVVPPNTWKDEPSKLVLKGYECVIYPHRNLALYVESLCTGLLAYGDAEKRATSRVLGIV